MTQIHQKFDVHSLSHLSSLQNEYRPILDDLSIVIPTLGRDILEQCLFWILSGSAWPKSLIIVQQGDNPKIADWLNLVREKGIHIKHIPSIQRGRSAGINRGLEQVETPFVAITDDDCFVHKDWLLNIANELRSEPKVVVTGRVVAEGEGMVVVVTSQARSVQDRPRLTFDSMSGGNMGTSLAVIRTVGLFEEDPVMSTAEDAEWSYRVLRNDISIVYEPNIVVAHFGWRDQSGRIEQYRNYALSHGGFYGKYLRRGDVFILGRLLLHLLRALRRWLVGFSKGDRESALIGKAYFLYLLPGILAGMRSKIRPSVLR